VVTREQVVALCDDNVEGPQQIGDLPNQIGIRLRGLRVAEQLAWFA
jgi:hypothetical protein